METCGGLLVKTGTVFVTILITLASFPLLAQQPSTAAQQNSPSSQQSPSVREPAAVPNNPDPGASAVEMSPINGELANKLDSKTAKAGDNVIVQTKESVKTANGTTIPTGSKLVGHVLGVQSSESGKNSQMALQFDHVELKGGQNLPIHSQIQSIALPSGTASTSSSTVASGPPASSTSNSSGNSTSSAPHPTGDNSGTANGGSAAGVVVAQNGNIDISTTSIPGVLLANNAPGQQDPRMAQASSILLGAKQDIQLASGTQMKVGISVEGGRSQ